jgi:uncharacterized membrane protein
MFAAAGLASPDIVEPFNALVKRVTAAAAAAMAALAPPQRCGTMAVQRHQGGERRRPRSGSRAGVAASTGGFAVIMVDTVETRPASPAYSAADVGALAHLYRGEMYQSKIWRSRLDTTTNWSVVVTGIALSVTFSHADASPIPLLLMNWIVLAFLVFEARRYLFYDLYRVRVRVMEINFYGPMLQGQGIRTDNGWNVLLAQDYRDMRFHIGFLEALGRRLRRTYGWLFAAQLGCYVAKIIAHPTPIDSVAMVWSRAAIGPVPGELVLAVGALFHGAWLLIAVTTLAGQRAVGLPRHRGGADPLIRVASGDGPPLPLP